VGKLFGTDGIRGRWGSDLDPDLVARLGRAAATVLGRGHPAPRILIGRDTRASGPDIERSLALGISSAGGVAASAGVIPTAAIARLVLGDYEAGAVISASHNPAEDNGIKFFGHDGMKLPDAVENEIEAAMDEPVPNEAAGALSSVEHEADERYLTFLLEGVTDLKGLRVVVDAANGAAYRLAPEAYRRAGANVEAINATPDGVNINADCGAVHPEGLIRAVAERGVDVGIAHDGDADRLIAVDETGEIVDGDQMLAICALEARERGALPKGAVVSTVMANLGFRKAMDREGIDIIETPVGDRYVLEAMLRQGIAMGGEQSGHLIFLERHTTGDGILSALRLMGIMASTGKSLSALAAAAPRLPQVLMNIRVVSRDGIAEATQIWDEVARVSSDLGGDGRVLVRPSGTEPLVRVMVEAATEPAARAAAQRIADAVSRALGV
jgi:phosphoglucosamine mutase